MKIIYVVSGYHTDVGVIVDSTFTNEKKANKRADKLNKDFIELNGSLDGFTGYSVELTFLNERKTI